MFKLHVQHNANVEHDTITCKEMEHFMYSCICCPSNLNVTDVGER